MRTILDPSDDIEVAASGTYNVDLSGMERQHAYCEGVIHSDAEVELKWQVAKTGLSPRVDVDADWLDLPNLDASGTLVPLTVAADTGRQFLFRMAGPHRLVVANDGVATATISLRVAVRSEVG